jgi:hypothetical protein
LGLKFDEFRRRLSMERERESQEQRQDDGIQR